MQNQMTNGQFAILYRTNAQSRSMEDALRKEIFHTVYMEDFFYQREER
jgi:DNA helicase-2/ATP-dependent DNA helicase PcrA